MGTVGLAGRSGAALAAALVLALALASPSFAAKKWIFWGAEQSQVINCPSQIAGVPYSEVGAMASAESYLDRRRPPKVGQVFYVRTGPGAVGRPCVEQQAVTIEVVLPRGVKLAISRRTPIRCRSLDIDSQRFSAIKRSQGCPRRAGRGTFGPSFNPRGGPWPLPYGKAVFVEIPVKSSRRLVGAGGGSPSCSRREGDFPCRRDELGHSLQFGVHVLDGNDSPWLSPHVPLFVRRR
jgi:hypothetical protein